ncbi:MAG: glycosyltransferase family 4 protein [Acidimicrobiales bacterium]
MNHSVDISRPDLPEGTASLRIALVAPPWFHVPPDGYGGIEAMVGDLVEGLVARGHQVTLLGAGEARTRAQKFIACFADPQSERLGDPAPEVLHAARAAAALADLEVDVVHDHCLAGPLLARNRPLPTVITAHGPVTGAIGDYLSTLDHTVGVVAISQAQQNLRSDVNWVATIYNALDVSTYQVGAGDGGYVLFLGRFNQDKGAHLAIDAARAAGRRILLAGKLNEAAEREYFDAFVQPRLGADAEYVGQADAAGKRDLLMGAEALMFPIRWEEPFGIVMIEAMACGTPVVALRRGSVPEVVDDGRTGIIVDRPDQLPEAIDRASLLRRDDCRAHVEANFDVPTMVSSYEAVYQELARTESAPAPR